MVSKRSKYLRGREGPQKEGGWELGGVWVGTAWVRLLFQKTPAVFLIGRNSATAQDPGPGNAISNIYCLSLYLSWSLLVHGETSNEGKWGVVISRATGDSSSELRT